MRELLEYLKKRINMKSKLDRDADLERRSIFIDEAISNGRDEPPTQLYATIDVEYTRSTSGGKVHDENIDVLEVMLEVNQEKIELTLDDLDEIEWVFNDQLNKKDA